MIHYEDLIGKPFEYGARGPKAYDCYGLYLEMAKRAGKAVPDYPSASDPEENSKEIMKAMQNGWEMPKVVGEGNAVLLRLLPKSPCHIGFMLDSDTFIHALQEFGGVVVDRISNPKWTRRVVGFFEYTGAGSCSVGEEEEVEDLKGKVQFVKITHPFDRTKQERSLVPYERGKSLADYLGEVDTSQYMVSMNGRPIQKSDIYNVYPRDGAQLILMPILMGGQSGRLFAQLGIAVLAAVATAFLPGAGGVVTAFGAAMIGMGIAVVGNMLLNLLWPIPSQAPGVSTYSWNGPRMTARQGIPIQKGYGKIRVSGNVIASYTKNMQDSKTGGDMQYLNLLVCFGHGPAKSLTNVEINENDAFNYSGLFMDRRPGIPDQSPVSFFSDLISEVEINNGVGLSLNWDNHGPMISELPVGTRNLPTSSPKGGFIVNGTRSDTQAIEVDITFPQGIWAVYKKGSNEPGIVQYVELSFTISYALNDGSVYKKILSPRTRVPWPPESNLKTAVSIGNVTLYVTDATSFSVYGIAFPFAITIGREVFMVSAVDTVLNTLTVSAATEAHDIGSLVQAQTGGEWWIAVNTDQMHSGGLNKVPVYAANTDPASHKEGDPYTGTQTIQIYDEWGQGAGSETIDTRGFWTRNPVSAGYGWGAGNDYVPEWSRKSLIAHTAKDAKGNLTKTAVRSTVRIDNLPQPGAGRAYNVKVTVNEEGFGPGMSNDDVDYGEVATITSVREIVYQELSYPGMILLGIRALATEQISGGVPNITAIVDYGEPELAGNPIINQTPYTGDNPAVVVWDMMTNETYGGGISHTLLDAAKFKAWADRCNDLVWNGEGGPLGWQDHRNLIYRHTFNGVFDQTANVWDAVNKVCAMSRAVLLRTGVKYTVALDKPGQVVQMFNVGNIIESSFKQSWLSLSDRANSIDVQYLDQDDRWKRRTLSVEDKANVESGAEIFKSSQLDLFGVTQKSEAWREAKYRLLAAKLMRLVISFDADVDSIACQVGDLIRVQHDVPQWGTGGRIVRTVDGNKVQIDQPFAFNPSKNYEMIIRNNGTDEVKTFIITNPEETTDIIQLEDALGWVPEPYSIYIVGEEEQAKTFRVIQISKSSDLTRQISAMEYNEDIYTDLDPDTATPPAPKDAAVSHLLLTENCDPVSGLLTSLGVQWIPGPHTAGVDIYTAVQNPGDIGFSPIKFITSVTGASSVNIDAVAKTKVSVRAVGYKLTIDGVKVSAPYAAAPTKVKLITPNCSGDIGTPGIPDFTVTTDTYGMFKVDNLTAIDYEDEGTKFRAASTLDVGIDSTETILQFKDSTDFEDIDLPYYIRIEDEVLKVTGRDTDGVRWVAVRGVDILELPTDFLDTAVGHIAGTELIQVIMHGTNLDTANEVRIHTMYLDEVESDQFLTTTGNIGNPSGHNYPGDVGTSVGPLVVPVTLSSKALVAAGSGTFGVPGDFFLINDPSWDEIDRRVPDVFIPPVEYPVNQRSYEIVQLISISGSGPSQTYRFSRTFTDTASGLVTPEGYSLGGTLMCPHVAGTKIFKMKEKTFTHKVAPKSFSNLSIPVRYDDVLPSVVLSVLNVQIHNEFGWSTVRTYPTFHDSPWKDYPCPGLRTLDGAAYIMQIPGDIVNGVQFVPLKVQVWAAIRNIYAYTSVAPTGDNVVIAVKYYTEGNAPTVIATLTIQADNLLSYDPLDPPTARRMPYPNAPAVDWATPPDIWPIQIMEGDAYITFTVTQVGSGTPGTDLTVVVQT